MAALKDYDINNTGKPPNKALKGTDKILAIEKCLSVHVQYTYTHDEKFSLIFLLLQRKQENDECFDRRTITHNPQYNNLLLMTF